MFRNNNYKILLKSFLILGIPSGALLSKWLSEAHDAPPLIISIIVAFLFSFLFICCLPFSIHLFRSSKIKKKYDNWGNIFEIGHSREINLQASPENVFRRVSTFLENMIGVKIEKSSFPHEIIAIKKTLASPIGEKISIRIFPNDDNTVVNVSSQPTNKFLIMDFGKNLENILIISKHLFSKV